MKKPVRVLVVDDSALMRQMLTEMLSSDPDIEVIDTASDPYDAREKIKQLNPDVITLDVEMPRMDGIRFLEKIMTLRPMPVVMVSSLTTEGAQITLQALELGAVDAVAKPSGHDGLDELRDEVVAKVKAAAVARLQPRRAGTPAFKAPIDYRSCGRTVVAIGASTGGVEALSMVLAAMPAGAPPILITQHMPPRFVPFFAQRLNTACAVTVRQAEDGDHLLPGHVYIAPGNTHLRIARSGTRFRCLVSGRERVSGHCPSVDVLFQSFADQVGADAVGVILTGMGGDGAEGLLAIRKNGGHTIGQDQGSSLIYGMPRVAFEQGAVEIQLPLARIAERVLALCGQRALEVKSWRGPQH